MAIGVIMASAVLSASHDPSLALASGVAFLLAELLDLVVYTPLQRRHFLGTVVASNLVGLVVDSIVFLTIAFGSLALLQGQSLGKAWMTLAAIPIVYVLRERDRKRSGSLGGDTLRWA